MAIDTFSSTKEFLVELLRRVDDGRIQLPDFQRGWVWSQEGISSLLASISLGYPVGTLMFLGTGGDTKFRERTIEGVGVAENAAEALILDGQQRMTSLYQAICLGEAVRTRDERGRRVSGWFYLDMEAAVDPEVDREEAVRFLPKNRIEQGFDKQVIRDCSTPEKEYEAGLFPLSHVMDASDWADGFREHHDYAKPKRELWTRFDKEVVDRFEKYQFPIIELGKGTPREAVCQVFEKVNTGGEPLTVFELLTATFATDEFELRTDWAERHRAWSENPLYRVLHDVRDTDFLQIVTLLVTQDSATVGSKRDATPSEPPESGVDVQKCSAFPWKITKNGRTGRSTLCWPRLNSSTANACTTRSSYLTVLNSFPWPPSSPPWAKTRKATRHAKPFHGGSGAESLAKCTGAVPKHGSPETFPRSLPGRRGAAPSQERWRRHSSPLGGWTPCVLVTVLLTRASTPFSSNMM